MKGKLRPVGNRVPGPPKTGTERLPWEGAYRTEYTRSGTEALSIAVAIAIQQKGGAGQPEVIIPAYGCPDLVSAVVAQGAKPVLVDLLPDCPFMSEVQLQEAITASTVAIVGVGLLGIFERLDLLSEICRANRVLLIEDSAQCFPPASVEDGLADLVVLSFGRGKPINLLGGGALLIRNDIAETACKTVERFSISAEALAWAWPIKRFVFNLLLSRYLYGILEGLPFLHIGETKFHKLETISLVESLRERLLAGLREYLVRPSIHQLYDIELASIEKHGWTRLTTKRGSLPGNEYPPPLRYALLAPSKELRDQVIESLNAAGIGASSFYGRALPAIEGIAGFLSTENFPVASDFASRLLTLPSHEDVTPPDVELAAHIISQVTR